ncbi:hypothetical protein ACFLXW_00260 [Candidatus Dependentiae bacterium]
MIKNVLILVFLLSTPVFGMQRQAARMATNKALRSAIPTTTRAATPKLIISPAAINAADKAAHAAGIQGWNKKEQAWIKAQRKKEQEKINQAAHAAKQACIESQKQKEINRKVKFYRMEAVRSATIAAGTGAFGLFMARNGLMFPTVQIELFTLMMAADAGIVFEKKQRYQSKLDELD